MQEQPIYKHWKDNNIFNKTVKENENNDLYSFYDGPPFATGLPHYGHILAGLIKDTVTRYHHNLGKNVPRHNGTDCHGLPIEYEIEKEIKIKTTEEILNYGIDNYNEKCRGIVMKYSKEWEETMGRLGRWIDFKNDYKTMTKDFMNSVWWVFKQLYNKNRVYEGVKIMPYSTTCGTPLSNFETQQNYQEVQDDSLFLMLPLVNKFKDFNVYVMIWTTTPWTLSANYALCVNNDIDYSLVEYKNKYFIVGSSLIESTFKQSVTIIDTFKGSVLVGLHYLPPLNFLNHEFKIIADNYVSDKDGTGVVHISPCYGEDDYRICLINNIINKETKLFQPLDVNGYVSNDIPELKGMFYKNHKLIDNKKQDLNTWTIIKLKEKGYYFDKRQITHNYPFCWRSDTPLIYRAVSSWFVKVEDLRDNLVSLNKEINWTPKHVGENRFNNWLANARDWGVSRSRFWGTPIPIWKSDDGDIICIESSYELEKLANLPENSITDLHRHNIDHIVIHKDGKTFKRISEIFDCWFESGAMPYASLGCDGIVELLRNSSNGIEFDNNNNPYIQTNDGTKHQILPADFIAEGVDQTRGWFYTLLVLSTSLFDKIPFKNVIVNGLILAEDGKKMSKRLKNYPDPVDIINEYGSDCLRLYLLSSPASRGETLKFSKVGVHNVMKDIIIPLSNTVVFWKEYYQLYSKDNDTFNFNFSDINNPINIWILTEYSKLRNLYFKHMDNYNLKDAIGTLYTVVDIVNNGYVKLGRNLLKGKTNDKKEWKESLNVLYYLIKLIINDFKSIIPFFAEKEYLNLKSICVNINDTYFNYESIHLGKRDDMIQLDTSKQTLAYDFNFVYNIIQNVYKLRGTCNLSLKKPIKSICILHDESINTQYLNYSQFINDECNVLYINDGNPTNYNISKTITPVKALFFKKYGKDIADEFKKLQEMTLTQLEHIIDTKYDETLFNINYTISNDSMTDYIIKEFKFDSKNIVILLDKTYDENMEKLYYYRLVATSIQKARKDAGLHPWDPINVFWSYSNKKYNLDEKLAIDYITNIIRVNFEKYQNTFNSFYTTSLDDLGITIYLSHV